MRSRSNCHLLLVMTHRLSSISLFLNTRRTHVTISGQKTEEDSGTRNRRPRICEDALEGCAHIAFFSRTSSRLSTSVCSVLTLTFPLPAKNHEKDPTLHKERSEEDFCFDPTFSISNQTDIS